eukprot:6194933-Pleurochrysis_carterae.AAC.2
MCAHRRVHSEPTQHSHAQPLFTQRASPWARLDAQGMHNSCAAFSDGVGASQGSGRAGVCCLLSASESAH